MNIEPADPQDLPRIIALLMANNLPHQDLSPAHLQHFLLAFESQHLAGMVGMELYDQVALLRSLVVDEQYRCGGIGTVLVSQAESYALSHNIRAIYLLTTTAEPFFSKQGYSRLNREHVPLSIQQTAEFHSLCPDSAVCMRKQI